MARIEPPEGPANSGGSAPFVVEAKALGRRFGAVVAVDTITLSVRASETFVLIGPNGAGKSTLMKMLTTLLPPSTGTARVAGFDIERQPSRVRQHIGYVPQLPSADTELTGSENMLLSARLYLIPARERGARIGAALDMMGLTDAKDRPVTTYSGGMVRRLEIAQSTLHHPAVLFLDEPTVGLDPNGRQTVWQHVRRLRSETGAAVIFSTHDMEEAAEMADRVGLVSRGRLAALGTVTELKEQYGAASLDALFSRLTGATLSPATETS